MCRKSISRSVALSVLIVSLFGAGVVAPRVAVGAVSAAGAAPATAASRDVSQQAATGCWPLDIVLLVDQSASMFAIERPNDRDGYRFDAAQEILNQLMVNRVDQCPEAVHRLGLITFGNSAVVHLPLVHIELSAADDMEQWSAEYRAAIADAEKDRTQQATDFRVAFEGAQQLFSQAPPMADPPDVGARRQLVVLLTDGNPDLGTGSVDQYMCDLVDYLKSPAWDNYSIWLLALNASGGPYLDNKAGCGGATIRSNWLDVLQKRNGRLLTAPYNEQTVPAYIGDVVRTAFGQAGIPIQCGDTVYIDPYLQEARFTFYRRKTDTNLVVSLSLLDAAASQPVYQITNQKSDVPPPGNMTLTKYTSVPYKEEYVFSQPRPGAWRFDVQGLNRDECQRRIEARVSQQLAAVMIQPQGVLPQYPEPPYYDLAQPIPFVVQLRTSDSTPIGQETDYPLLIKLTWAPPSGAAALPDGGPLQTIELQADPNVVGQWNSRDVPVLTPEDGAYQVNIVGTTLRGDRSSEYTLFSQTASFTARQLERLNFVIESPKVDEILPCNSVSQGALVSRPVPVVVRLLDSARTAINGSNFIASNQLDQVFQVKLMDGGASVLDTIPLKLDQANNVFQGTLLERSQAIVGCGKVAVEVSFTGELDSNQVVMPVKVARVSFERARSEGVMVKIVSPEPGKGYLLHPDILSALPGRERVQAVPLELQLTDLSGNRLNPAELSAGAIEELYQVRLKALSGLVGPADLLSESLRLTAVERPEGVALVASGGLSVTAPGAYSIEIEPQMSAFKAGYIPAVEEALAVNFERFDTALTTPLYWMLALIVVVLIVAGVLMNIAWNLLTRPLGELQFATYNGTALHTEYLNHNIRRTFRAEYKTENPTRQALRLSRIVVRRTKPDVEKGGRAIKLDAYDEDNQLLFTGTLHSGDSQEGLGGDVWVKYE